MDIECWTGGKSLKELCPPGLEREFNYLDSFYRAYEKSFKSTGVNLTEIDIERYMPAWFVSDWRDFKEEIKTDIRETYEKPANYEHLLRVKNLLKKIERQKLRLSRAELKDLMHKSTARTLFKNLGKIHHSVKYNMWKASTGRLVTEPGYFPILNLDSDLRSILKPQNDWFVELDFNSAELRVAFYFMSHPQPDVDIHLWIKDNIYKTNITRDRLKAKTFSWLYNPEANNKRLEKVLDRKLILENNYSDGLVNTPFGRKIPVGPDKALSYLIQSTTSDLLLEQALKVDQILSERKCRSFISFMVHDSLVLDLDVTEKHVLADILTTFKETRFGDFKTNVKIGKNYGCLKAVGL